MIKDNATMVDTYILVPLYNVSISAKILNKTIHGYKFITSECYFNELRPLFSQNFYMRKNVAIDEDLLQVQLGAVSSRPKASYLLVKKLKLPKSVDGKTYKIKEEELEKVYHDIVDFIIACRLEKTGDIHINTVHTISSSSYTALTLGIQTPTDYIWKTSDYYLRHKNLYEINEKDIKNIFKIKKQYTGVLKINEEIMFPIKYFMQYYSTSDIFDKIVKLAISWESCILKDDKTELGFRLMIRTSALLKKDLSECLKLAYDMRSSIVHNGILEDKHEKKLRKYFSSNEDTEVLLGTFVKEYLEEVTRQILKKIILKINKNKIRLKDVVTQIDQEIFESFSKKGSKQQQNKQN